MVSQIYFFNLTEIFIIIMLIKSEIKVTKLFVIIKYLIFFLIFSFLFFVFYYLFILV